MQERQVLRVDAALVALQIIALGMHLGDVAIVVPAVQELVVGEKRRLTRAEVSEDDVPNFVAGVCQLANLVFELTAYWLARLLVNIDSIAMVNILADRPIVPEFIQGKATAENILPVALELMDESPTRKQMIEELKSIREMLSSGASENAAREILSTIEVQKNG